MFHLRTKSLAALLAAPVALCLASGLACADTFDAPLLQCKSVTTPAALAGCASTQDPLKRGGVTINDQGDVTVIVFGAATNTTYNVALVSNDGTQTTSIDSFKTDQYGDGFLRKDAFFKFGTVGAGNVTLSGAGGEEFVTGLLISSNGLESARDWQPALVRCTDVTTPAVLSSCGSDSLTRGRVDIENPDGALSIHVTGARPSTTYSAILRSQSTTPVATPLGSCATDKAGNGMLVVTAAFAASTMASGSIVLQNGSTDEFVSGFRVDQRFIPPKVAESHLVACGSVTDPVGLICGSDPLDDGFYKVEANGQISVFLTGANPSTNYEAWFRPIDLSGDVETGIKIATDINGNGHAKGKGFFAPNTVASGTIVIKEQGSDTDQFLAGYEVH
jgi:hypothetical protein